MEQTMHISQCSKIIKYFIFVDGLLVFHKINMYIILELLGISQIFV